MTGTQNEQEVIHTILGLVALTTLAWLAGHPKLQNLERKFAVNPLIGTGLIFVFLGWLGSTQTVGLLTEGILRLIAPIVPLGLGWMGFRVGYSYNRELFENAPPSNAILLAVIAPLVIMTGAGAGLVWLISPEAFETVTIWRDILLIGVACAMTSSVSIQLLRRRRPDLLASKRIESFVELEQAAGVIGLMFISIMFRPQGGVGWQLPPAAWLFVTMGVGSAMGLMSHILFRTVPGGASLVVMVLGAISMAAGLASFLRLSVIAVCFLVGLVVANMPGAYQDQIQSVTERMGRPVFFVLMLVAGALWNPFDWRGWLLMAALIASRLAGKEAGLYLSGRGKILAITVEERRALALAPIGAFAIAVTISARDLYADARLPIMLTGSIGCAVVSEIILQFVYPRLQKGQEVPAKIG